MIQIELAKELGPRAVDRLYSSIFKFWDYCRGWNAEDTGKARAEVLGVSPNYTLKSSKKFKKSILRHVPILTK